MVHEKKGKDVRRYYARNIHTNYHNNTQTKNHPTLGYEKAI